MFTRVKEKGGPLLANLLCEQLLYLLNDLVCGGIPESIRVDNLLAVNGDAQLA